MQVDQMMNVSESLDVALDILRKNVKMTDEKGGLIPEVLGAFSIIEMIRDAYEGEIIGTQQLNEIEVHDSDDFDLDADDDLVNTFEPDDEGDLADALTSVNEDVQSRLKATNGGSFDNSIENIEDDFFDRNEGNWDSIEKHLRSSSPKLVLRAKANKSEPDVTDEKEN